MIQYKFLQIIILISVSYAFRVFDVSGKETILALEHEDLTIRCRADMPMAYCGFIHPSGERYSYSFTGSSLDLGQCEVKIKASKNDNGDWRCHIGIKDTIGLEQMRIINLRVVKELAAIQKNISSVHGKQVTIACATTNGMTPLKYCRFEPPNGKPFSINSEVSSTAPILNRYFFPNNKSLDRGDCAVTIRKVKYEDVGVWTCGAGLDDGKEHIDTINMYVEGFYTMSTASATGITFGALGIVVFLGILGFIVWKKRQLLGSGHHDSEMTDGQEMREIPIQQPRSSRPGSRQGSISGSRQGSPQRSRQGSPLIKRIPLVTVQSPSEASMSINSPAITQFYDEN